MKVFFTVCVLLGLYYSSASIVYSKEALADEITNLPGVPSGVTFKMFSGYIPLNTDKTKQLFYWFVESQGNPSTDPLVLWTNGGPGCSGLTGFLTELGPFRPTADGNLTSNPYSWNKIANMIFIEQPVGVGFSIANEKVDYGDAEAAEDNYNFILGFLKRFGSYANHSFYATSESYGGHYMPTLAKQIVESGGINFKGFAVGNPLTYMPYRNYGQYGTFYNHQLLPKPLWEQYLSEGCGGPSSTSASRNSAQCLKITDQMDQLTSNLNAYGLDFPVCTAATSGLGAASRNERHALQQLIRRANGKAVRGSAAQAGVGGYFPADYQPCSDNWATTYLNRKDVQTAIHAVAPVTGWEECSNSVGSAYNLTDVNAPMMPVYTYLINEAKLNILVYSGDDDSVCATLGSQQWIWDMGKAVTSPWAPWELDGQTVGYRVAFDGFTFATVHGAGHMVPATRPAQALQVFTNYLSGKW